MLGMLAFVICKLEAASNPDTQPPLESPAAEQQPANTGDDTKKDPPTPEIVKHALLRPDFSDEDVFALQIFAEPLVPSSRDYATGEHAAFLAMINALTTSVNSGHPALFLIEEFLEAHPASRWRPALEYNLGIAAYQQGHFSKRFGAIKPAIN